TTEMDFTTGEYLGWADAERAALVELASDNLHSHGKCSQEVWHYCRTVLPPSWTDARGSRHSGATARGKRGPARRLPLARPVRSYDSVRARRTPAIPLPVRGETM